MVAKRHLSNIGGGLIVITTILETLSEWGAYFLGMTLCSDSQGRSTSLSLHRPQNPTTPPFLSLSSKSYNSPPSPSPTLPHPNFPNKFPLHTHPPQKISPNSPISPTLLHNPTLLSTLFPKTTQIPHKFHYFQPKISHLSQNFYKINKIHTKKSHQFPNYHTSIPQNGCKNTFLKTSQTHPSKSHAIRFIAISLINRLIHNFP